MPQLTLTLSKNSHESLLLYALAANKTPEQLAEFIIESEMVTFLAGVKSGINQSIDIIRESKTPATDTPKPFTSEASEPHTLESEASKISDVYKF